jgi:hypothetical protein
VFLLFHIILALLILALCIFLWPRRSNLGLGYGFLLGWALQVLLSLLAGLWQAVFGWPHISSSDSLSRRLILIPLTGWPFNAGGYTVRWVFEATVEPLEWLVGHRSATVMSNMPYYWFLLAVQGSVLAILFALRYKRRKTLVDWLILCLGILFLVNSFTNVTWFWAGT